MIVECSQCGWHYDDAKRWTICPHNLLEYSPSTPYCHEHDLYNCPHHSAQLASAPNPKSEAAAKCMTVLALVALLDLALWCAVWARPWPALIAGGAYAVFSFMARRQP